MAKSSSKSSSKSKSKDKDTKEKSTKSKSKSNKDETKDKSKSSSSKSKTTKPITPIVQPKISASPVLAASSPFISANGPAISKDTTNPSILKAIVPEVAAVAATGAFDIRHFKNLIQNLLERGLGVSIQVLICEHKYVEK
jgi:hypothetical protein